MYEVIVYGDKTLESVKLVMVVSSCDFFLLLFLLSVFPRLISAAVECFDISIT